MQTKFPMVFPLPPPGNDKVSLLWKMLLDHASVFRVAAELGNVIVSYRTTLRIRHGKRAMKNVKIF